MGRIPCLNRYSVDASGRCLVSIMCDQCSQKVLMVEKVPSGCASERMGAGEVGGGWGMRGGGKGGRVSEFGSG